MGRYYDTKILSVCTSVRVCITEVGHLGGRTNYSDAQPLHFTTVPLNLKLYEDCIRMMSNGKRNIFRTAEAVS